MTKFYKPCQSTTCISTTSRNKCSVTRQRQLIGSLCIRARAVVSGDVPRRGVSDSASS